VISLSISHIVDSWCLSSQTIVSWYPRLSLFRVQTDALEFPAKFCRAGVKSSHQYFETLHIRTTLYSDAIADTADSHRYLNKYTQSPFKRTCPFACGFRVLKKDDRALERHTPKGHLHRISSYAQRPLPHERTEGRGKQFV